MTKIPEGVMPRSFTKDTLRTCASENCEMWMKEMGFN